MSADIRGCLKPGVTHNWWTCHVVLTIDVLRDGEVALTITTGKPRPNALHAQQQIEQLQGAKKKLKHSKALGTRCKSDCHDVNRVVPFYIGADAMYIWIFLNTLSMHFAKRRGIARC
jgi:hypothetical protein